MTIGTLGGRLVVAVGVIVVVLMIERLAPIFFKRLRIRRRRSADGGTEDDEPRATAPDPIVVRLSRLGGKSVRQRSGTSPSSQNTDRQRPKTTGKSPRSKGPALRALDRPEGNGRLSWKAKGNDPLARLREEAVAGTDEAWHKMSKAALARGLYVEAYYWKLKVELSHGRYFGLMPYDIQREWVKKGCLAQHMNVAKGFSEAQSMFARAVLRLRAGVDVAKAMKRLLELEKKGNEDAKAFLHHSRNATRTVKST